MYVTGSGLRMFLDGLCFYAMTLLITCVTYLWVISLMWIE